MRRNSGKIWLIPPICGDVFQRASHNVIVALRVVKSQNLCRNWLRQSAVQHGHVNVLESLEPIPKSRGLIGTDFAQNQNLNVA